ncbi:MAG: hypothetical protein GEU75_09725 [Dehalococcoidia bacterium]|nr:hypothetical protein [Dehalococcoidia bacterium]
MDEHEAERLLQAKEEMAKSISAAAKSEAILRIDPRLIAGEAYEHVFLICYHDDNGRLLYRMLALNLGDPQVEVIELPRGEALRLLTSDEVGEDRGAPV